MVFIADTIISTKVQNRLEYRLTAFQISARFNKSIDVLKCSTLKRLISHCAAEYL